MPQSNTCSTCQYWRSIHIVDASAIADPKTVPVKDLQLWCSNSKSPNFRYKSETFERFVIGENTCEEWAERGKKAPILQRIMIKLYSFIRGLL